MITRCLAPALAAVLLGCPADPSAPDAGAPDVDAGALPPCDDPGELLGLAEDGRSWRLADHPELPVVLGFQGFMMVQVELLGPAELDPIAPLRTHAVVADVADVWAEHPGLTGAPSGARVRTGPILVFFNDATLSDLVGRSIALSVYARTRTCTLELSIEARLGDDGAGPPVDGGRPD